MSDSNSPEKKNPKEQEVERDQAQDSEETSLKLSDDTDSQDDKNTSTLSDSSDAAGDDDASADSTDNGEQSDNAESGDANGDRSGNANGDGNGVARERPPVTAEQMADIDRRDPEITAMKELLDRVRDNAPTTLTGELNPDGRRQRTSTTLHGADGNRIENVSNHPQFGQIKQTQFISGKDEGKVLTEFENHPAIASIEYDSSAPEKAPVITWREGAKPDNNTEIPPIIEGKDGLGQPWQLRADGNLERFLSGEPAKVVQYTPFDGAGREQSRHFSDRVETVYKDRLEVSYNDPSSHNGLARVVQREDGSIRKEYSGNREDGLESELITSDAAGRIKERTYNGRADGLLTETEHIGAESTDVERTFEPRTAESEPEPEPEPEPESEPEPEPEPEPESEPEPPPQLTARDLERLARVDSGNIDATAFGDRAVLLKSLKQFTDVNADDFDQRNQELAIQAAARLGGREALEEMGFEIDDDRRGFSTTSGNGTRFEFTDTKEEGSRLSAIRNRPDGGVFVNHWNDDGSLAKSYEQVFDGEKRTDYMRDADGDITEIRRPDGSTVNISYEGESQDGSKIATAIRDSNGHELLSEDGKNWRNALDSKAESFEAQLVNLEGGEVRLSGPQKDLILGTDGATTEIDKVSGLATITQLDGISITRDTTGEVVATVNRQGEKSTYTRDPDGELKAFTDSSGAWRKDAEGIWHNERTGETDSQERFVDAEGRLHVKDAVGAGTIKQLDGSLLTVDSKERITEILSANNLRTRFEYKGDDPGPTGIRYNNSDRLWVATDEARSQWKEMRLEGERRIATGKDWQGTIEASSKGHRETNALSGNSIERNADGSITTRNRDNDITRLRTARGDVYNFKYSRPHSLTYVEKPDGSTAASGGEHGWYTDKGRPMGGARVNQETGAYTEFNADLSSTTIRSDGGIFKHDKYRNLNGVDLGSGRTAKYERDEAKAITTGEVIDAAGNKTVSVADGSREVDTVDGRHLAYDSAGFLETVKRPDQSTVTVERADDGTIERLVDSKSAIAFQRQPDGSYLREGSQPPDLIEEAEAFFNEDGTYGFRNEEREILKTDKGFRITSGGTTTELLDTGAMRLTDTDGKIEGATTATGLDWSFERTGALGDTVDRVRVGDRVWTREGEEPSWTSNDGRSFKGEIESDAEGNLRFIDAETKFETVHKLDGSTVFRDVDGRVHQVNDPSGDITRYAYNSQGGLARIELPDGTVLNRLNDRKVKEGSEEKSIERWVEAGTTRVSEGSRSVDSEGNLVYKSTTGETTIEQTDGWRKRTSASGETTFTREADNGSSVTKNAMGQIVSTRNAAGFVTRYGYDEAGQMNSVRLPGGESYSSEDGGKTWEHKVVRGKETTSESGPGKASITADGSFVFRSFETDTETGAGVESAEASHSKEVIHKSDGSVLVARDGRFTTITPPGSEPIGIGYDAQGKANSLSLPGESGQWRSDDGEHWTKYDASGNLDSAAKPQTFKLDVGADGSIRKVHGADTPPYTEILRPDGSSLSFNDAGQKLQEIKVESYRGGKPRFSTTEYHYSGENGREGSLEGYNRTEPDGSSFKYDNLGRLTRMESGPLTTASGATRPRQVRELEYVGDTDMISAVIRNGERFDLDRASLESGTPVYKHGKEMLVGRFEARDDGTLVNYRADGALVYDNLDGSSLTQLGDGSIMKNRYDGLLEERVRTDGIKESYRYNLSASDHVLGRRNEISSMTYHYPDGNVNHWTTTNGFDWSRREDGKVWRGFEHIDHKTGRRIERPMSGNTYENRLDGSREEIRSMNIEARTREIEKTFDYWTQRGKIADIRSQLRELDADETYMVRRQFDASDHNALAEKLDKELGGHRLTEATGYLKRSETLGYDQASSNQGENYAIQLEVDAQEMDRWWWNRDRSKEEILTSTRHILGSASEAERLSIDAAYGRMFSTGNAQGEVGQNNLARFYGEGGAGHNIANWDSYHRTLISIAAQTGADKRSPEQQAQIISSALDSAYGNRLDYMSEASGRAFSSQEGRDYFLAHGGEGKIREAFTQTHYTEDGSSYTTTDGWSVEQATDYARLGELRPITEFKKAFGVFSNDQKAMEHALSRLSDEQRALLADGKQLFDDGTMPQTEGQKEALAYYKSWHKAFRDAHWFSEDAKATGYEDQALRKGGTGINRDIAPIGTHWTNSHEINATAIEDMNLATFNLLTQGIGDNDAGAPSSPYYEQMQDALAKNLGSGEYQERARALLAEKMRSADALMEAADAGNTDYLHANVPALKDLPSDQWQKLSGGYALEESLKNGAVEEENLTAEQAEMLAAYREDNELRAFMEGREVARHLNEVDTGEALGRYIQGKELNRRIENGEVEEAGLSETEKESLKYFTEYSINGDILEDNDLSLANSAIIEMRARFFQERGDASKTALETYQKMLYESVRANVRRDLVDAIKDNDHTFSDNHGAMLEAISEMTDAEIDRYRDPKDSYKKELNQLLAERMGGENSTAYKAAQFILGQMENGEWNPSTNPEQSLTFDLLEQRLKQGYLSQADAARTIQKELGANEGLQERLARNPAFAEAATLALGGEAGFDKIARPLLENGHLPISTLIELNTRIISDGEGQTHEEFLQGEFLEDAVLNATPQSLAYLASEAGAPDREKILAKLSPDRKEIVEAVLTNRSSDASTILEGEGAVVHPRVDPEDRIRAAITGEKDLEEIKDILSGLDEKSRSMAVHDYQLKYGSQLRADLFERASSSQRSDVEYLTRTSEWSTEQSHLFNIDRVASTDAGIGGSLARNWNMMHRMALTDFEVARLETEGHIEPERMRKLNEAVDHAVDAFRETKEATAETVVNGIITAGALAAAPFTGGTSLGALFATGGVIVGGGLIGAGGKYLLMGNDHEGMRTLAGDFVKFSALTAANVIGAEHLALVGGLGRKAALSATEKALADVAFQGLSREVKDEVAKGMMRLVRDGIAHGGGVADDAIIKMLGKVNGLDDVARTQLARGLQTSLREAVDQTARTGLRQVLRKAQDEATSMGLISLSGAAGNVIGDSANMLITRGEIDSDQLLLSGTMGGTFAFGFGGVFKLGGNAYSRLLSRAPETPYIAGAAPPHADTGDNVIPFVRPEPAAPEPVLIQIQNQDRLAARLPETPGHLEADNLAQAVSEAVEEAAEVYRPRIEAPDAATVERLSQEVPELGGAVAEDFGKRIESIREGWGEDLSDEFALAQELAPKVDEAKARLDQEIARLEAAGHSPEAIREALTSKKHPLHKDSELKQLHTEWKTLADQHAGKTRKVEELAQARRDQIQTELDRFVAEHNRKNPDSPLPAVKVELANNMAAAGGYSFGEGVVVLPRAELIKASGGRDLSRAVFHEVVHSQQDMDIIRTLAAEQLSHADGGGINNQLLKEAYKEATGRDLNENWMRTVLDTASDAAPLNAARQQRAIVLADEVARTVPVAELSRDLADTASYVHNRLARLSDGARNANWNEFMADLARPGSGEEMARRLFGEGEGGYDAMPANLRTALEQWKAQPKNSKGLPNNFKFEPELKDSVIAHLKSRLDTVNTRHRQLIDAYAGSRLETEAYGFDSKVSQALKVVESDITRLPPPREYSPDRVEAPDKFRTDEIARLEQESASFSYAMDVRYGLLPTEKTPFADKAQGEIFKQIQDHVLKAPGPNGGPSLADQGWTVLQSQKFSAADQAGGDYILLNRKTGEYHILDATERPDKKGNIVERIVWNRNQFESGTLNRSGVDLVAARIGEITAKKPVLNVVDQPLPSLQRPADLIDGREQLRQWQTALRVSEDNAVKNFANQDLEGVIKYYHHKLRESSIEYKTELQAFQESGDRSVREALLEYYGLKGNAGGSGGGFNNQTPTGTAGNVKVTHNEISMTIGRDRYNARVTADQVQELEKEIFGIALETSRNLPAAQRSAAQDRLYALRQRLNEDSIRNRAATLLSEQDPGRLLGKEPPPKSTPSKVRYSQEEVNALYAASGAWNELRDSMPGTRLGDDFDEYVHLALEDLQDAPGLTAADREAARVLLEGYRTDNPEGVKRVNDYLEGRDDAPWRADAGTGVKETLDTRSAVADRPAIEEVPPLSSDYHRIADGTEPFAAATPEFDRNIKVLQNELDEIMDSWPKERIERSIIEMNAQSQELSRLIEANRSNPDFDPYSSETARRLRKATNESNELLDDAARSIKRSLDDFADANGLTRFELSFEYRTDSHGTYSPGQGKVVLSAAELLRSDAIIDADGNLNRIIATVLHESKHVEQDQLIIRYLAEKSGVQPGQNLKPLLEKYERRFGRQLNPEWAAKVLEKQPGVPELAMDAARAEALIASMGAAGVTANFRARLPHIKGIDVIDGVLAKLSSDPPDVLKALETLKRVSPLGESNLDHVFGNDIPDSIKVLLNKKDIEDFANGTHPLLDNETVGTMIRDALEERFPEIAAADRSLFFLQPHEIEAKASQELVHSVLDTADRGRRIGLARAASVTDRSNLLTAGNTANSGKVIGALEETLDELKETPGRLSAAEINQFERMIAEYRAGEQDAIRLTHEMLDLPYHRPADFTSANRSRRPGEPLSHMRHSANLDVYEPLTPPVALEQTAALERAIPALDRKGAQEMVDLMATWKSSNTSNSSVADDLRPAHEKVLELHDQVEQTRQLYSNIMEDLKARGVSADDIKEASRRPNHALNEDYGIYQARQNMQRAVDLHVRANLRLGQKVGERVGELQKALDQFTEARGLPPVKVTTKKPNGNLGDYSSGEGTILIDETAFLEPGGDNLLPRVLFHELVHHEQDTLLVRKAIQDAGLSGKELDFDNMELVRARYEDATGIDARALDQDFIARVADTYKNAGDLSPDQLARAQKLAEDARAYRFEIDQVMELGNTARVLSSTGRSLLRSTDSNAVNKLFQRLDGDEGNIHMRRMFGDVDSEPIPKEIEAKLAEWKSLPRDENGLAVGFEEGDIRNHLIAHIERRLDRVNTEHKQLVDSYFDNGLEKEAYGLDHLIVDAERQRFGDDYHRSFEPRAKSRATADLEGVDSSNLARNLDSAYRYNRGDLQGYNLRFGANGEPQLLNGTTIKLGRGDDMQVKIGSDFVSREHAQIFLDGNGKPHIMNLSNTNKTFVNGVPVEIYTPLKPGDVIGLGFYRNNEFFGQQLTFGDSFNSAMPLEKGLGQYQIYNPLADEVMDFKSNKVSLGRAGQNADIEFPADTISARHAEIELTPEGPLLRDTNSRNGTYVNGERITERILKPGDRVKLSEQFEFVFGKKVLGELEDFKLSLPESGLNLEFPQGANKIVVGRGHDVDVKLVDDGHLDVAGISRRHAEFRYEDGKIIVEDLGSTNGTFVNGKRIESPTELKPGDAVRFGQGGTSEFIFEANTAIRVREPENVKIEGTDFNRGDRVRLENPRYADHDAIVAGKDPDSDQLIVVVHNDLQGHVKVLPESKAAQMRPVEVNGQTLLKDEHNVFYQRFRLNDGTYSLISRPDVHLFSKDAVREAFAQIDYRVGQFVENPSSPDITGEVLAYDNASGNPIVRLKQSARTYTKKSYEANSSYDQQSGTLKIGDQELKPIDVEGQKYYHDGEGNVYGADFSPDGKDAFVFKQQNLRVWDRASSFKSALQPRRVEFGPPHIEMPRSFDELPDARAPRGHRDNVLYQNTEFFLRDQPMLVNGKPVNFEGGGEIAVGRELLGIEYDGAGQYVSAEHGKFGWDQDRQLFYFDDHSRNGTFVRRANSSEFVKYNGTMENPRRVYLAPGDELRLGRVNGEKLNLSLSQGWAMKRGTNVEATTNTQVFFDGQRLEMDGNTVDVGRKFQVYGNNNPTDALNRRVARHHAQLEFDEGRGQWNITDLSGGSHGGGGDGSIHQTIMVRDQGNGIFIKQGGTDRISFHANETVPLGPNDRVYIGSSRGPELKLVTRQGQPLGDGRVSFLQDNLDRLTTRPDGSHNIRSYSGSQRLVSPDGTVAEATTVSGQRLRFKYENRELAEIVLPDNSTVMRRGDDNWVRLTQEGKEEPWWKGGLEVESDGSLLYRTTDKPPNMVRQRLDNVVETIDAKGRVSYSDIDYNFERQTLKKYGESLGHPERVERFGRMIEDFEMTAKHAGMTETQIAESYHQIRRLLQADEGSMLNMVERQKLAEQTLYQMSHPEKVSQGSNNTCNVTTVEKRILQRHPEEFARLVADVATTGKYVTADGTLIDMSRVPGALEPDREARMLDTLFRSGSETDIHLDGRRSWASQMFETTAVGIKYARGGSVHGEHIGQGEIVMYQKQVGLPGQEAEQLVKYSVGADGRLNSRVLEDSPHISTAELADINNQIIGRHEENFVLSGHYFPDSHGNNRYWREQDYSAGALKVARNTEELKNQLLNLQDSNNMPAIALVHTGHSLFGGHGPGSGGAHVINIQSIRQTPAGAWVVDFTNQWGDAYNKTIPIDEMFRVMNAVE